MQETLTTEARLSVSLGRLFFKHRNWFIPAVMIALCAWFRPLYLFGSAKCDAWLDLLGLALVFVGRAIRALVVGGEYIYREGEEKRVYAKTLVTVGLFRHCRNPLYIGNILVFTGVFLIFNNPAVYAIGITTVVLVYCCIVAAEEEYLRGAFGEQYEGYCRRVGRWVPTIRGLRTTLRRMEFRWSRALAAEYTAAYSSISAALLVLGFEGAGRLSAEQQQERVAVLVGLWILATLGWGVVHYLRARGRVRAW